MSSSKVLNNLNIRKFPTLGSYKSATIGEDDLNVVMGGKPLIQVTALPTPSADWVGEVVQLIADDQQGNSRNGFFTCEFDGDQSYYWTQVFTQQELRWPSRFSTTTQLSSGLISFNISNSEAINPCDSMYSNAELLIDINTDSLGLTNTNHFSAKIRLDSTYSGDQTIYEATGIFADLKVYITENSEGAKRIDIKKADNSPITNTDISDVRVVASIFGQPIPNWFSPITTWYWLTWVSETELPEASSGGASVNTTATLAVADWSSNTQTVTVSGVKADSIVFVSPAPASAGDYASAGILCTAQAADSLTFTCTTTPSNAITVNVVCL